MLCAMADTAATECAYCTMSVNIHSLAVQLGGLSNLPPPLVDGSAMQAEVTGGHVRTVSL